MADASASRHELHIAMTNDTARTERVFVAQFTVQHVGKDLHILVRMSAEAHAGRDEILIDHAQGAETHMLRVVII